MAATKSSIDPVAAFHQWRNSALLLTREKKHEQALEAISVAAFYLHSILPPPFTVDPSLEACLIKIAAEIKPQFQRKIQPRRGSKLRIAHIVSMLRDGGGHSSLYLGFLNLHDQTSFDVKGYCLEDIVENRANPPKPLTSRDRAANALKKWGNIPLEFFPVNLTLLEKVRLLYDKIIDGQINLAVVHGIPWDTVSALTAQLKPGAKFIYLHVADAAFNLGPDLFDLHIDFFPEAGEDCAPHVDPARHLVIPGLCDPLTLEAAEAVPYTKAELGFKDEDTLIGTFGALWKVFRPGKPVFFQMMKRLLEHDPDFHYLLIGSRPGGIDVQVETIKLLGEELARRVHFFNPRDDFLRVLKTLDLYINGFPGSGGCIVLEAMAAGVPLLAMIPKNDSQYHITYTVDISVKEALADSPEEIAEKAIALLASPERRANLGMQLKERFNSALHPRKIVSQYEDLFVELLK